SNYHRMQPVHEQHGLYEMFPVQHHSVCSIDHRDQFVNNHVLESAESDPDGLSVYTGPNRERRSACLIRITTVHYDDHWYRVTRGHQIVKNEVRSPLPRPAGFVLSRPVLEDEYRVPALRALLIVRRGIYQGASPGAGHS